MTFYLTIILWPIVHNNTSESTVVNHILLSQKRLFTHHLKKIKTSQFYSMDLFF